MWVSGGWMMGECRRALWARARSASVNLVTAAAVAVLAIGGGSAAAAKPAPVHKTKSATAHPIKPAIKGATKSRKTLSAAARKKAAAAARRKEAARVARVIKAAGPPPPIKKQYDGVASFYTGRQRTAAGGRYNPSAMTAAHRSLPFGTKVRVLDRRSGRAVTVTINDRGPYKRGRVIDLSRAAARALGMGYRGVSRVRVTVLQKKA
jgi:rare lipoprotein A